VRPAHVALDGQTVKVEKPFIIAGEQAMYPGDFPSARLSINCRCTTVAEFDVKSSRPDEERRKLWGRFDKRLATQEERAAKVVRAVFARQRAAVLDAFTDAFDLRAV